MTKSHSQASRLAADSPRTPDGAPANDRGHSPFWPKRWWQLVEWRIGVIPLPVFVILVGVVAYFVASKKWPTEINMSIAVLALFGFSCAEAGNRLPGIRHVGGGAIFATFIPSALVYYHLLPSQIVTAVTDFTTSSNFLYLFIAAIVVGSILSLDRRVLIGGFVKIFIPLAVGSVCAAVSGTLVGTLLGLGARHTFFFLVVPIMAGGVGEGVVPLSMGYADILHQKQGNLFAQILPIVMLGSLTAILVSGALNLLGKRYPYLTGNGRLQPGGSDDVDADHEQASEQVDVKHIAAAGIMAIALYLLGLVCKDWIGLPAPLVLLFIAVLIKLTLAVPPQLQSGSFIVYKFFQVAVTYPLLFAISVAATPWEKLIAAFAWPNLITIVVTVLTLIVSGIFAGRWVGLYPIEAAIVNACHSGQGGTGDVAILTAANRMQLMPFAQVATRIGGALTVTAALIAMRFKGL